MFPADSALLPSLPPDLLAEAAECGVDPLTYCLALAAFVAGDDGEAAVAS